jgi:hypothetical protein
LEYNKKNFANLNENSNKILDPQYDFKYNEKSKNYLNTTYFDPSEDDLPAIKII